MKNGYDSHLSFTVNILCTLLSYPHNRYTATLKLLQNISRGTKTNLSIPPWSELDTNIDFDLLPSPPTALGQVDQPRSQQRTQREKLLNNVTVNCRNHDSAGSLRDKSLYLIKRF